eukprot:gnl/MRDRNA2_/MRDRNA2_181551_c0_seq1.p1 gnl/MRDRNA2_/MRDRNA2_181551_c0~~gnl/MRDRNA2_/MRDRNA2_181551_c0_seq1.p1  ORF type:complete len:235 (-),score=59.89 gnl/MRDRNA2_/MRDRNA2_181551_c0_seq1:80-754(-)
MDGSDSLEDKVLKELFWDLSGERPPGDKSSPLTRLTAIHTPTCSLPDLIKQLHKADVVHLPSELLTPALLAAAGEHGNDQNAHFVNISFQAFQNLAGEKAVKAKEMSCRESHALWACLWALGCERSHEIDLMGQLFEVFDTSGDGWFQFEEFAEFMKSVDPEIPKSEAEYLFLQGAEGVDEDMTKECFIELALRAGITANIDRLEAVVEEKKRLQFAEFDINEK